MSRLSGGSHRCRIPCVTIGGAHPWHLFLFKAEHCNGDTFRCKQVFQKKYFARRRQGSSGKKSGSDPMNSSPGSPRKIAVLSATPQHSSSGKTSGVAGAMRLSSRCATESPASFACVADVLRVIRNALRLVPHGFRQLLRMLRQNFGGWRGENPARAWLGGCHSAVRRRRPETTPTRLFSRRLYSQWLKVLKYPKRTYRILV